MGAAVSVDAGLSAEDIALRNKLKADIFQNSIPPADLSKAFNKFDQVSIQNCGISTDNYSMYLFNSEMNKTTRTRTAFYQTKNLVWSCLILGASLLKTKLLG